ncbi:MAG: hypothetical protein IJO75_01195 [Clostridia bacterium]|nr:hypothetical protein [Clostridia bacterium]
MSIADKLVTIAENQSKVYDAGKLDVLRDSKYMNASASGTVVSVNDVSPIEHNVEVTVGSKNLLPFPYYHGDERTANGVTFTVNGDGTINATNTATATAYYYLAHAIEIKFDGVTTISASGLTADIGVVCVVDGSSVYLTTNNQSRQIQAGQVITSVRLYVNNGATVDISGISVQLEKGTTTTAYAPYVEDLSQVNVKRYGKNLFENDTSKLGEVTYITSSGEERTRIGYAFYLPAGTYTQRAIEKESGNYANCFIYTTAMSLDGRFLFSEAKTHFVANESPKASTFTVNEDFIYYVYNASTKIDINISKSVFEKFDLQIECGDTATAYESYIEPTTYTANADGIVEGVKSLSPSMTLLTDTDGVTLDCSYLRDIDIYINGLIGGE